MTFEEILPGIIVIGYVAVAGLGYLGTRLRGHVQPPRSDNDPAATGSVGTTTDTASGPDPSASGPEPSARFAAAAPPPGPERADGLAPPPRYRSRRPGMAARRGRHSDVDSRRDRCAGLVLVLSLFVVIPFVLIYLGMVLGRIRRRRANGEVSAVWP